jgi:hypothetical protein
MPNLLWYLLSRQSDRRWLLVTTQEPVLGQFGPGARRDSLRVIPVVCGNSGAPSLKDGHCGRGAESIYCAGSTN